MLYYFFLGDSPVPGFYMQIKFRRQGTIQKGEYNNKFQIDIWIKRYQLDVICFIISLFTAQHVSDVNSE